MIQILEEILKRVKKGEIIALVTVVDASGSTPGTIGSKMIVNHHDRIMGTIGGGILEAKSIDLAKKAIRNNKSTILHYHLTKEEASLEKEAICGGDVKIFVDVIRPKEEMIIFGAGHIALYLSKLAKMVGFKVTVVDEREEFANKERFTEADNMIISEPDHVLDKVQNTAFTYIVIVTRGHSKDEEALLSVIHKKFRYIGMIGSKKKNTNIFQNLQGKGINQRQIDRIYSPIGIDIGAKTPAEIAISIIAEVIQVRRGKTINGLKNEDSI